MRNALVVWGGWEGHEPEQAVHRFVPFLKENDFDVTVTNGLDVYTDADRMSSTDLVVQCCTQAEISAAQLSGLVDAVAAGTGLAGWHGGIIDAFRTSTTYQFMTGGQWVAHPDGIIPYFVDPVPSEADHPIMQGIGRFEVRSEQYYVHADPSNHVLATTTFGKTKESPWVEGSVMPVVWTRQWDKGRVFVSTVGHVATDLDGPEVKALTGRGLLWAAR